MLNPVLNGAYKPFVPTFTNVPVTNSIRNSGFRGSFNPSFNPYTSTLGARSPVLAR